MTGTIILSDGGQNYIEFDIIDNVIQNVQPAWLQGWVGAKILNKAFFPGGGLTIDLQWKDYDLTLQYPIIAIDEGITEIMAWLLENMSAEPEFYTNPRTGIDHMSYVVDCNGMPLYFDEANEAAAAAAKALLSIDKIPLALLNQLDGVQLVDEDFPDKPYVMANIQEGLMTVYGGRTIDTGLVSHEAAHAFAESKWGSAAPPRGSDYAAAANTGEPVVSEYAATSVGEDFAEAVRMYVTGPGYLKKIAPLRYDVIHRLMTDPGYSG